MLFLTLRRLPLTAHGRHLPTWNARPLSLLGAAELVAAVAAVRAGLEALEPHCLLELETTAVTALLAVLRPLAHSLPLTEPLAAPEATAAPGRATARAVAAVAATELEMGQTVQDELAAVAAVLAHQTEERAVTEDRDLAPLAATEARAAVAAELISPFESLPLLPGLAMQ